MSLVIIAPGRNADEWLEGFRKLDKELNVQVWPDINDASQVIGAVVWNHPEGVLREFPNLKFISSMGAGVDHVLKDPSLPEGIPIVRIVDDALTKPMTNYLLMATLYFQRKLDKYITDKYERVWDQETDPEREIKVGVMGLGVLGTDIATKLAQLEFEVYGFSNSRKDIQGVQSFAGENELPEFLSKINVLICLLPLTQETKNILNMSLFKKLNKGTFIINAARGRHLVEEDLIEAIDEGIISGAFLDVYRQEPLPPDHPFWNHPKIMMTPHIASITNPPAAIPQIFNNLQAAMQGRPLENKVDMDKEY